MNFKQYSKLRTKGLVAILFYVLLSFSVRANEQALHTLLIYCQLTYIDAREMLLPLLLINFAVLGLVLVCQAEVSPLGEFISGS